MARQETVTELLEAAERIAAAEFDGHLTILRFTTHWKAAFGTPDLDGDEGRAQVAAMGSFPALRDALAHLVSMRPRF